MFSSDWSVYTRSWFLRLKQFILQFFWLGKEALAFDCIWICFHWSHGGAGPIAVSRSATACTLSHLITPTSAPPPHSQDWLEKLQNIAGWWSKWGQAVFGPGRYQWKPEVGHSASLSPMTVAVSLFAWEQNRQFNQVQSEWLKSIASNRTYEKHKNIEVKSNVGYWKEKQKRNVSFLKQSRAISNNSLTLL